MWRLHKPLKHKCSVFILSCKCWWPWAAPHSRWVMPGMSSLDSEINHTGCWFVCPGFAVELQEIQNASEQPCLSQAEFRVWRGGREE